MFILRLLLSFAFITLPSCESADIPKYEEMSEFELAIHNSLLPENEQIVCQEKRREWIGGTFRRIPRRCFTIGQLKRIQSDSVYASIRGVTTLIHKDSDSDAGSASAAGSF